MSHAHGCMMDRAFKIVAFLGYSRMASSFRPREGSLGGRTCPSDCCPQTAQPGRGARAYISNLGAGDSFSTSWKNSLGFSLCRPLGQSNNVPLVACSWRPPCPNGFPALGPFLATRTCSVLQRNRPAPSPGFFHVKSVIGSAPHALTTSKAQSTCAYTHHI